MNAKRRWVITALIALAVAAVVVIGVILNYSVDRILKATDGTEEVTEETAVEEVQEMQPVEETVDMTLPAAGENATSVEIPEEALILEEAEPADVQENILRSGSLPEDYLQTGAEAEPGEAVQTEGLQTEGLQTEGLQTEGLQTEDSQTEASQTEPEPEESTQSDIALDESQPADTARAATVEKTFIVQGEDALITSSGQEAGEEQEELQSADADTDGDEQQEENELKETDTEIEEGAAEAGEDAEEADKDTEKTDKDIEKTDKDTEKTDKDMKKTDKGTEETDEDTEETDEDAEKEDEEDKEDMKEKAELRAAAPDGVEIVVKKLHGTFPAGAYVKVLLVASDMAQSAIEETLDQNTEIVDMIAYDITIYDKDGKEIVPDKDVRVTILGASLKDGQSTSVYHIEDDGEAKKVVDVTDPAQTSFMASGS